MEDFEDHSWRDVIPGDVLELYRHYHRDVYVGGPAALVAIDLCEYAYAGGNRPVSEVAKTYPNSCGEYAWGAIAPTQRVIAAARRAGVPIFHTTVDTAPNAHPANVRATNRQNMRYGEEQFAIRPEFALQPGDTLIRKVRASGFFGTPLAAHLTQLGIQTIVMLGESTSGCLRASAVDAYSHGFHVALVEECCYDRSLLSHKVNLFDLHHKYADVMHVDAVIEALEAGTLVST